jgi:Rps23 Pro-64 3,4-dihydroxylase Tpa1-like proline 4-hydroxylase
MSVTSELLYNADYFESLGKIAQEKAEEYQNNSPYPHIVLDGLLPAEVTQNAYENYPGPSDLDWHNFDSTQQTKLAFPEVHYAPEPLRDILYFMNSWPLLAFLETLTGIPNLIADSYYSGGGLHQIRRGGHLDVHADFNKHDITGLDRRLNMIVYLNPDWKEEYGGHFEMWNEDMTVCAKKVLPVMGRVVVFSTTSTSFHGHPEQLSCPPDISRKSLATFYYTNGRPESEQSAAHSTLFQKRPASASTNSTKYRIKRMIRAWTPPIIMDTIQGRRS